MKPKDPKLQAVLDLMNGSNCGALDELLGDIEQGMASSHSLAGLSEVEADLMATVTMHGVVGNGGFYYWYQGADDASKTRRVADAFARMGASSIADLVRGTLDGMPERGLSAYAIANGDELAERFRARDEEMWDVDWNTLAARYILANESSLSTSGQRREWIAAIRAWLEKRPTSG